MKTLESLFHLLTAKAVYLYSLGSKLTTYNCSLNGFDVHLSKKDSQVFATLHVANTDLLRTVRITMYFSFANPRSNGPYCSNIFLRNGSTAIQIPSIIPGMAQTTFQAILIALACLPSCIQSVMECDRGSSTLLPLVERDVKDITARWNQYTESQADSLTHIIPLSMDVIANYVPCTHISVPYSLNALGMTLFLLGNVTKIMHQRFISLKEERERHHR